MFGISGGELLVLLVVGLLVLGPRHAAQAVIALRKGMAWVRGLSQDLRAQASLSGTAVGLSAEEREALRALTQSGLDPRSLVRETVRDELAAWTGTEKPARPDGAAPIEASSEGTPPAPKARPIDLKKTVANMLNPQTDPSAPDANGL